MMPNWHQATMPRMSHILLALTAARISVALPWSSSIAQQHNKRGPNDDISLAPVPLQPVLNTDFPDPCSIPGEDGRHYAFATTNGRVHVQMASTDSPTMDFPWILEEGYDALPNVGAWVNMANETGRVRYHSVWAPDVHKLPNGDYIMYYSARPAVFSQLHCIGSAISKTGVRGPYLTAHEVEPLICNRIRGGVIDAEAFVDPATSKLYLVYKIDGNAIAYRDPITKSLSTPIMLQEMDRNDGRTKIGEAVHIFDRCDTCSDGGLVEAPTLLMSPSGKYFLFYSTGGYADATYTTKYAVATAITGPYVRAAASLLNTRTGVHAFDDETSGANTTVNVSLYGPGGADIDPQTGIMLFHMVTSRNPLVRPMLAAKLQFWSDDTVEVSQWYTPSKVGRCDGLLCWGILNLGRTLRTALGL